LPFLCYGYSDNDAGGLTILENMVNRGVAFDGIFGQSDYRIGVGVTWAEPADVALYDQIAIGGFYRVQAPPEIIFGPALEVIIDPARNRDQNVLLIGGIRSRFVFYLIGKGEGQCTQTTAQRERPVGNSFKRPALPRWTSALEQCRLSVVSASETDWGY